MCEKHSTEHSEVAVIRALLTITLFYYIIFFYFVITRYGTTTPHVWASGSDPRGSEG